MDFARAHNSYLEPPEDDPICEDGCGQSLVWQYDEWVCNNKFCPIKYEGREKEMAIYLAECLEEIDDLKHINNRLKIKLEAK